MICENCGGADVIASPCAYLAPFFAKRVHDVEVMTVGEIVEFAAARIGNAAGRGLIRGSVGLLARTKLGRKLARQRAPIPADIIVCKRCSFVGPQYPYSEQQLNRLYVDYRSAVFNAERGRFDPRYLNVKDRVGKDRTEIAARLANVGGLLRQHVGSANLDRIGTVLDWAGGEGRFVPQELTEKKVVVLDVSTQPLANPAYARVSAAHELDQTFDYVQLCHILEHVRSPRTFATHVLNFLKPGGYLYIEVPQDRRDDEMRAMQNLDPAVRHRIDEHINLYNADSVRALGASLGLKELVMATQTLDLGWARMTIVSGVFQRPDV